MKIYSVEIDSCDEEHNNTILGLFSSREKAYFVFNQITWEDDVIVATHYLDRVNEDCLNWGIIEYLENQE